MWFFLSLALVMFQITTRGVAPEPAQVIPLQDGPHGPQVNWTQFLAGIAVISTLVSACLALMMKLYIEPRMVKAVEKASENIEKWAMHTFPSSAEFLKHSAEDHAHQLLLDQTFRILNQNLADDREVIADIRDRLARLEGRP